MLNRFKRNQKGFTLVEVIVVAVIVAVLAAVAIPLYMGYIKDSRTNVCQSNAATIATAFSTAFARGQTPAAGWIVGQLVTIPADPTVVGSVANTISVPAGYTATVGGGGTITVTGPNGTTSSAVPYR